jgi:hypothetical protein
MFFTATKEQCWGYTEVPLPQIKALPGGAVFSARLIAVITLLFATLFGCSIAYSQISPQSTEQAPSPALVKSVCESKAIMAPMQSIMDEELKDPNGKALADEIGVATGVQAEIVPALLADTGVDRWRRFLPSCAKGSSLEMFREVS